MTRPLIPLLACFSAGLVFGAAIQGAFPWLAPLFLPVLSIVFALLGLLCYGCYRRNYRRASALLFLALAFLAGSTRYLLANSISPDHISNLVSDELVTIEGYVDQPVEHPGTKRHVYLSINLVEKRGRGYRSCGRIRLTLTKPSWLDRDLSPLVYGDTIRARVHLAPPKNFSTDFDYREYLRRRDVSLIGTLHHERNLIRLPVRQGSWLLRQIYQLRSRILDFLDAYPRRQHPSAPEEREAIQIIKAMTVGERRGLSREVRERFRQSGLYHFLVISGVHIGILAWAGHQLLQILKIPLRLRNALLPLLLCAYAALTGFQFPVMRAVVMACVFYLSIVCSRMADSLYSLLFSIGLLLFLFPNAAQELSFQLTVAATASIILVFRVFRNRGWDDIILRLPRALSWGAMSLTATSSAMLGVAPLLLFHFGRISLWSFLSNPLALPIVSVLVPSCLLTEALALLFPGARTLLTGLLGFNVLCTRLLTALSALFPPLEPEFPPPPGWLILLYYVLLFGVLALSSKKRAIANQSAELTF